MKLTEKQLQLVNKAKQLEVEHGQGNVFLRHINDYLGIQFIIHFKGNDKYDVVPSKGNRVVHGNILNALEHKGLLTGCDINHNENVDPNSWRRQPEGWYYVGSRIKTELL